MTTDRPQRKTCKYQGIHAAQVQSTAAGAELWQKQKLGQTAAAAGSQRRGNWLVSASDSSFVLSSILAKDCSDTVLEMP